MFIPSGVTRFELWDAKTWVDSIGGLFDSLISRLAQLWGGIKNSPISAKNAANGLHGDLSFCSQLRLFPPLLMLWEEWNGIFLYEDVL